jgi:hypothetical protein
MTPELQKNTINTIYLLFSHNYIAFVYLTGILISTFLAITRPSRYAVLLLLGFIILLFSFEYDKHIIVPFREQTLKSLITSTPHYKLTKLIDIIIADIIPIITYLAGWTLVFISIISAGLKMGKKN